ncbi:thiamine phosphate synthase [Pseudomaricurvus alkylphenolicus]|uniref:thiamine phosphate synthase n=1 Tax=Pseudomaricurvus alkylphenolicus TaxID=1306991 RepID=UPI00142014FB|nr:thiamine phosphate synthase [Pseudomaricurvus alkylphenolicus]NIB44007.1 thiamine phosphate synthase [Pseudomaricurvus alkylphenolicus]
MIKNSASPIVCAISASDSSAHAGHQCDLRVIQDLGGHGVGAITALTAQNSQGVDGVAITPVDSLKAQLYSLTQDLRISAIKTGLLLNLEQCELVLEAQKATEVPLVVDPVLSATTGRDFGARVQDYRRLTEVASLLTPNLPEAEQLLETPIKSVADIENAARKLRTMGAKAVLLKGGHGDVNPEYVYDYYCDQQGGFWLRHHKQNNPNRRGTGCSLAAAVASFVAHGKSLRDAVILACAYVQQGIEQGFSVGKGPGLLGNGGWPKHFHHFPDIATSLDGFDSPAFSGCDTGQLGLYPIVDSIEWLEKLLPLGVKTLQLRIKDRADKELDTLVRAAVALGKQHKARLFINDHWQLAIKHGAYGVHLGQEDMDVAPLQAIRLSGLRLGLSSHSEYEWARAASFKPSYLAIGSVFATSTKSVQTIGLENLKYWSGILGDHFPLVAIGGITRGNIADVMACAVGSAAVISAITAAQCYTESTQELQTIVAQASNQ